ncbi:hypothetical protein EPN95_02765 [Patescibacteria group bacterium]|nr:MAG: hypothetical protein EPN95_02765 [Patescibacteria group bacterium]
MSITTVVGPRKKPFIEGLSGAYEWTDIDYKVKSFRMNLAGRKLVTTEKQYKQGIRDLKITTGYKKKDLRRAVCRQLMTQYPADEIARDQTPAIRLALTFTA